MELYTRDHMINFAKLMVMTPEKSIDFEEQFDGWLSSTRSKPPPISIIKPKEQWVEERFKEVENVIREHILQGLVIEPGLVKEYSMLIKARTNGVS